MSSLCVITSKAPYGSLNAKEALDTALIAAAFDLKVSLIFDADGVYQLLDHQSPTGISQKKFSAAIPALELYGIESLLVCRDSIEQRGINPDHLIGNAQLLSKQEIAIHLESTDLVLSF